jgi:hypothetical protein
MRIENFRYGFATNSSSSHSVVFLPEGLTLSDRDAYDGDFGWNRFVCASQEGKLRYLAAQSMGSIPDDEIKTVFQAAGVDDSEITAILENEDRYVDHQSSISMNNAKLAFLTKLFMSPKIAVLGGNDNDDEFEIDGAIKEPVSEAVFGGNVLTRLDGDHLTIFNRYDGTKVRFTLSDGADTFDKGAAPELVDLKITDHCTIGCAFCYQASTGAGQHAPLASLQKTIAALGEIGVFEIAIGGGEPTAHPDFVAILKACTEAQIVPNFTTLSEDWLSDERIVEAVKISVGGIGVSCLSAKGLALVEKIKVAVDNGYRKPVKVMAQHVIGSVPLFVTTEFLNAAFAAEVPVLLLGFKEVGFGGGYKRHDTGVDVASFLKMAVDQANGKASLSIDTALVDQYPDIVAALGAVKAQVTSPEGAFSCYIDGVRGKIAKSSYVEESEMADIDMSAATVLEAFAKY